MAKTSLFRLKPISKPLLPNPQGTLQRPLPANQECRRSPRWEKLGLPLEAGCFHHVQRALALALPASSSSKQVTPCQLTWGARLLALG